ncbi:MAG: transposase [Candidatus Saganbacteria bacterium]|nr:transposase [Candidatus Saganbacteria bacterium]
MQDKEKFKRKRIRAKGFDYTGQHAYSIAICAYGKNSYFQDTALIKYLTNALKYESKIFGFGVYAYCFMPDHLHLLLIGDEVSNLVKFIKIYKQKTGYFFKQKYKKQLWQKSYYDHVLRKQETLNDVALYILNNPIRKNLVDDFRKYPFSGSFLFNVKQMEV